MFIEKKLFTIVGRHKGFEKRKYVNVSMIFIFVPQIKYMEVVNFYFNLLYFLKLNFNIFKTTWSTHFWFQETLCIKTMDIICTVKYLIIALTRSRSLNSLFTDSVHLPQNPGIFIRTFNYFSEIFRDENNI